MAEAETQLGEAMAAKQSLETQVTDLQNRITSLTTDIQNKETEITKLGDEKRVLEGQASSLQATIESQNTRIFNLESERSRILGVMVTQHYEWVHGS